MWDRSTGVCRQSMRPALFLRKSNSTFSWPICLQSSSFSLSDCCRICSAVAEDVRQIGQRLSLPAPDLGRVDAEHLRDLHCRPVRLDGLHSHFGFQAGRVTLAGFGH
jgi:hypothetical protein